MSTATATFQLERFAWSDGAFEVAGRWSAPEETHVGRPRLIAQAGGRRLPARPPAPVTAGPDGIAWQARFPCKTPPQQIAGELEVGRELVVELPAPDMAAPPPKAEAVAAAKQAERGRADAQPAPAPSDPAPAPSEGADAERARKELEATVAEARELREQLRALLETAQQQQRSAPPPTPRIAARTPRRAEIRAALARPREPRTVLDFGDSWVAYAVAAAIVFFLVLLLVIIL
jgi:hypothetical protein